MQQRSALSVVALLLAGIVAAAAAVPPAPLCAQGGDELADGWQPVAENADVPSRVWTAIKQQLTDRQYVGLGLCASPAIRLKAACMQVVAGQNVQVAAQLSCVLPRATVVDVQATVWVRLGAQQPLVTQFAATAR